jgi:prefoldin subunit 5
MGDKQKTQLSETIKLAQQRLEEMKRQRDELGQAIEELAGQIDWAEQELDKARHDDAA